MIDFRYHLVSIVAVFLALGVGLLLGATALRPATLEGLQNVSKRQHKEIEGYIATNSQQAHQLAANDQFAQANAPQLLRQLLAGQRVVVVEAPGAPSQVTSGVMQALTEADATVSGQVQLSGKFFDFTPASQEQLGQLAEHFAPAGAALGGAPLGQASSVLAGAILTKDGPGQPVAGQQDATSTALLNGFQAGGFLSGFTGQPDARATLAVLVIPASPQYTAEPNPYSQALITLAQQLNLAGQGTVLAGSVAGSGPGSAIDVLRTDGRPSHLSTVDNADYTIGQIVVAQALYEQLRGVSGNFGSAPSATEAGPSPAPTPSPTPSASLGSTAGRPAPARSAIRAGKS